MRGEERLYLPSPRFYQGRVMKRCQVFLLIPFLLLAACAPQSTESPLPTPAALRSPLPLPEIPSPPTVTLAEDLGGVTGEIVLPPRWEFQTLYIYACPFSGTEEQGFFVLEPSIHPQAVVGPDGKFQLSNVPPGAYVFVVGPTPEQAVPITKKGYNRPAIFYVSAGQILNIGRADLLWPNR